MRDALERHDRMLASAVRSVDGELFKHTGDGISANCGSGRRSTSGTPNDEGATGSGPPSTGRLD